MAFLKRTFLILLIIIIMVLPYIAQAKQEIRLYEQEIKAGLIYNFLKYTTWPAASLGRGDKINLCLYGDDTLGNSLQQMEERSVNRKEITITTIYSISDKLDSCHMLFISASRRASWPELQDYLSGKNTLTISDFEGFATSGGMIEFTRKNNHIGADLNQDALTTAKLSVQQRLLNLVHTVRGGKEAK